MSTALHRSVISLLAALLTAGCASTYHQPVASDKATARVRFVGNTPNYSSAFLIPGRSCDSKELMVGVFTLGDSWTMKSIENASLGMPGQEGLKASNFTEVVVSTDYPVVGRFSGDHALDFRTARICRVRFAFNPEPGHNYEVIFDEKNCSVSISQLAEGAGAIVRSPVDRIESTLPSQCLKNLRSSVFGWY